MAKRRKPETPKTSLLQEAWKSPRLFIGLTRFIWRVRAPYFKITDHDAERLVPPIYRDTFWFLIFTGTFSAALLLAAYLSSSLPSARIALAIAATAFLWRVAQRFFESTFLVLRTTEESREIRVLGRLIRLSMYRLLSNQSASATAGISDEKRSGLSLVAWITSGPLGQLMIGDLITKLDLITISLRFLAVLSTLVLAFGMWGWCLDFSDSLGKAFLYSLSVLSTVSIGGLVAKSMTQMWVTAAQIVVQIVIVSLLLPMLIPFYERAKDLSAKGSILGRTLRSELKQKISDHQAQFPPAAPEGNS